MLADLDPIDSEMPFMTVVCQHFHMYGAPYYTALGLFILV